MNKELRKKRLEDIQKNEPAMTGIKIKYKGEFLLFKAYKIPLDCLIYNKYNGRIGSLVKSYEKQHHELDPENKEDKKKIEQFLWESKKDRNNNTMEDLIQNGQKVYGIVTSDGVIIDGNRRASLLNKIYNEKDKIKQDVSFSEYFIAVILPKDADKKEILKLETSYQMGEDEKLAYNPTEKYLRCKDLLENGIDVSEISKMMNQKESKIKEWISIMKLMDEYLDYLNYNGIYTRLEKIEDHFISLNEALKKLKDGNSRFVNWNYKDLDVNDFKLICFDYIRARYEGKEFRFLSKISKKENIFCKSEELWKNFSEQHFKIIESVKDKLEDEKLSTQEILNKTQDGKKELTKVLEKKDYEWSKVIMPDFKKNLGVHKSRLENINLSNKPFELAKRAKETLESINPEIPDYLSDDSFLNTLKEIMKFTSDNVRYIEKERKRQKN